MIVFFGFLPIIMYTLGLVHMLDSKHRCKDTKVKVNPFALSVLILDYWTLMLA